MIDTVQEIIERRELLYQITWREIKIKYKQSVMGVLWALLMPLVIVAAGLIVRYAFARLSGSPLRLIDVTAVTVKAAPWAFFVAALRFGTNSLVANTALVTKIYLPRLIFPLAAVGSQLLDLMVAGFVVTAFLTIAGAGASIQLLWVPALLAGIVFLAVGFAVLFSAGSLFFRDVKYLVEVGLTFAIFITPVFYEADLFGAWAPVLLLNPISPLLEALADTVIHHRAPDLPWLLYSLACAVILLFGAVTVFRRAEPFFAESV